MTSVYKFAINFTSILFFNLAIMFSTCAQTVVTLSFDDPSMVPSNCFTIFTEEGIPQELINNGGGCFYDYSTSNGGELWLFPATLSVDLSGLGTIEQVEIDINDFCGTGCSQASLLNNGIPVLSTSNITGAPETLLLDNSNMLAVDELQMSSFEGLFFEIRITYSQSDPCQGTGDSDNDSVCDALDMCPGFDDLIDRDGNGIPDYCDFFCDQNRNMIEASQDGDVLIYEALEDITSGQVIESGAVITFNAGSEINLIEGFEVELGADFNCFIFGCGF